MGDLTRKFILTIFEFGQIVLHDRVDFEGVLLNKLYTVIITYPSPIPSPTMNLTSAWINYLKLDQLASEINANSSLVAAAIRETKTSLPLMTEHKSLTMVSKPTLVQSFRITRL